MSRNCVGLIQNITNIHYAIVPRLIIETRHALPYTTWGLIWDPQNRRKRDPIIEFLPDRVWDSSELKRDTSNLVRN